MAQAGSGCGSWSTPTLLRHARNVYRFAIRDALDAAGYDDMPRDGAYVVGAVANSGVPLTGLIRHMGVSKQSGGQLVDTLVVRGYLDRSVDPEDRRRLTVTLTERGQRAAAVVRSTVDQMDARFMGHVGQEPFANVRAALASFIDGQADLPDDPQSP